MKKYLFMLALLWGAVAGAAVGPCQYGNPWQAPRGVQVNENEYKEIATTFEVTILAGSGGSMNCMLTPKDGVSLVVPKGFNPEEKQQGRTPRSMSWVKVGSASFPILSRYNLSVIRIPDQGTLIVEAPQQEIQVRQSSLLVDVNTTKKEESGFCRGWWMPVCIVGGIIIVSALLKKDGGGNSSSGGPVNPAP
jgi:hypothetical protein